METDSRTVVSQSSKPNLSRWKLSLATWPRKAVVLVIAIAVSAAVEARVWGQFAAAWITRGEPGDPALYEQAIRFDPGNATYHFRLAKLLNSPEHLDVARARGELEAAARLNPDQADHWLELSRFREAEGGDPREPMRRALEADPQNALLHWSAANLYIRLGDLPAAELALVQTVRRDPDLLPQVLDLAWRIDEDPERILSTHVPDTPEANLMALNYFIAKGNDLASRLAWNRLQAFPTEPRARVPYVEYLVAHGRVHEAWNVFKGQIDTGRFFNGSFESEFVNGGFDRGGFDWHIGSTGAATVRRDTRSAKDGLASLLVAFSGKENPDFREQVWHWLPVEKRKSYALSFWMKTEGISTNEGVYVEVDGQISEKQLGTTPWRQFRIPFTASGDLAITRLRRDPSRKFDNLLKGKVWVDGFDLAEIR